MRRPKASDRVLEKLVADLSTGFKEGLPFLELPEGKKPPDAFQKAAHILRNRPSHFWAVSPNHRLAFDVHYLGVGFRLWPRFGHSFSSGRGPLLVR
jgi:hypothetical protein